MTPTSGTAGPLGRGRYGLLAGGLLTAIASAAIALPVAHAAPQQCNDVGNTIDSYLKRHPAVKQELNARAQQSGSNIRDYLNNHPDVRQNLIKLSHQCVP